MRAEKSSFLAGGTSCIQRKVELFLAFSDPFNRWMLLIRGDLWYPKKNEGSVDDEPNRF